MIFVDSIGHGRSSKPSDGLRARFPAYGYEDMVTLPYTARQLGAALFIALAGTAVSPGQYRPAWLAIVGCALAAAAFGTRIANAITTTRPAVHGRDAVELPKTKEETS